MSKSKEEFRKKELEEIREYLSEVHCMTDDAVEEHIQKNFPNLLGGDDVSEKI